MSKSKPENSIDPNLYEWILNSTGDAIYSNDLNGLVTSWNRASEEIFGYSKSEMLSRPISIIYPPNRQMEEQG